MTINLTPGKTYDGGSVLRVIGTGYVPEWGQRFGIGAIAEGDSARQVTGGPLVPGPWAYAYALSVCIDNHGGTAAESARMEASGQEVRANVGDVVTIDGTDYRIDLADRGRDRHNIKLVTV